MTRLVIDASIAVKWVVEEEGTRDALAILRQSKLAAPDLIMAECANILWKKVQRKELLRDQALIAAGLIQWAEIEIFPMRQLLEAATSMAVALHHPAYDCAYLALAVANGWRFVTADARFLNRLRARTKGSEPRFDGVVVSMREALAGL